MNELKLPRLISNGMVLQQKKKIHIWGWDAKSVKVDIAFLGMSTSVFANSDERFDAYLEPCMPGGPYTMQISDELGNKITIEDILVGDVWLCSGQSNMELSMIRVKDKYPDEIASCKNDKIRTFKLTAQSNYHGAQEEHESGNWKSVNENSIYNFSAISYFFAKKMFETNNIPFGFIDASLGGSPIESWMSKEMLFDELEALEVAKRYSDDEFVQQVLATNESNMMEWHDYLDATDVGIEESYESEYLDETSFKKINIPCFFRETELNKTIGSIWFRKHFTVPDEMVGKTANLWLGTIVDSDITYLNEKQVGHTDYQYPPRKYSIPRGLLKKDNILVVRVKCERGEGRFTPNKKYAIFNDNYSVDLSGEWLYKIGATCEQIKDTDFINWKPTGLYNALTAPCENFPLAGFAWYQGESNANDGKKYEKLFERMVNGYRKNWNDESLPFLYVQLPNFQIDLHDSDNGETGTEWAEFREYQRRSLSLPNVGMVVSIDTGEDNDLHPLNKKDLGDRLAYLALNKLYDGSDECVGPQVSKVEIIASDNSEACKIQIVLSHVLDGIYAKSEDKGNEILDFEVMDEACNWNKVKATIEDTYILLELPSEINNPQGIRYCFGNTNNGALIFNNSGFPMSPFVYMLK